MERPGYDDEVDLSDYVAVLIRRKWLILVCMLGATFAGLLYGQWFRPPATHKAMASLLVTPPVFKTELSPELFGVDVYVALADAQDLKQAIIDSLGLRDADGNRLRVTALDGGLETEAAAQSAGSSLIHLRVTSTDTSEVPPVAVANAWAELFVEKNTGLSGRETVGSYEFIAAQHAQAEARLDAAESALREFGATHRPELMEGELSELKAKVDAFRQSHLDKSLYLKSISADLKDLARSIAEEESPDGIWIGFLGDPGAYAGARAQELARLTASLRQVEKRRRNYRNEADQDLTREALEQFEELAATQAAELSNLRVMSEAADRALALVGANPVEANGRRDPVGGAVVAGLSDGTVREMASIRLGYNLFAPRLASLERELPRVRSRIDSLQALVARFDEHNARLDERYVSLNSLHTARQNDYQTHKLEVATLRRAVSDAEADVRFTKLEWERLDRRYRKLAVALEQVRADRDRLNREAAHSRASYDKFSGLLEDATVAKAHRSGEVKLVARAVEASEGRAGAGHFAGIGMGAGAIGAVFLAFLWEAGARANDRASDT